MIRRALAAAVVAGALSAACGETTIDSSRTTMVDGSGPATTAFAPTGPALVLLPELSTELSRLSALVIDNEGDEQAMARIDALWNAARAEVTAERPDLVERFETSLALARSALERRRPADADKAFNNVSSLVDAYVGDG